MERHLDKAPDDAAALHDLGVAFARSKRLDVAIEKFIASLYIDPSRTDAYGNLARAYSALGKPDEAEQWLLKGIENAPTSAEGHRMLGEFHRAAERHEAALAAFEKAVSLDPSSAELHHERARSLGELKRRREAKAAYLKALEVEPKFAEALNNLGVLCQDMGQTDEAIRYLTEAVRLRPGVVGAYNNLGVAFNEQRKFQEAIDCYNKAVAIAPDYAIAWNNLGNALRAAGKVDAGISALEKALKLKPDYPEVYNNLAIAYVQKADHLRAMECYNKALCFRPDYPECHMNRGLERLLLGDMENGWADYEWRWQLKMLRSRNFKRPRWDGSPLSGKRILLHYEQGLGDTIQFIRYASELKQRGATVIFEGQKVLRHILARTPGLDEFVARGEPLPEFDVHSPLLSLPAVCQTTARNIPSDVPYVLPDPHFVKLWAPRLEALGGVRIGIAWQGNPEHRGDHMRSIPLTCFEPLSLIPGVRLVSLQRNYGSEQVAQLSGRFEVTTFEGIDDETDGFLRTAAIIQNLDLVIAADTGVAHLAAAMGKSVWIAIAKACDWRWLRDREDNPWYPTVRLFRQREAGNWCEVFERIRDAVKGLCATAVWRLSHASAIDRVSGHRPTEQLRSAAEFIGNNNLDRAQSVLDDVLRRDPTCSEAHHDLGVVLGKLGRVDQAIDSFRRALEFDPRSTSAFGNIGLAFLQRGQFDEAVAHLRKAIRLGGGSPEVHNNLGLALMHSGDPAAAESSFVNALHIKPEYAAAHCNLARSLLVQAKFEQGWLENEWRLELDPRRKRKFIQPRWMGSSIGDKTILLHAEARAATGEIFQMIRYAWQLKQQGGRVVVECPSSVAPLFAYCTGVDEVVVSGGKLPTFDVHAPLLSLPAIFRTTIGTIPASVPYLTADPALLKKWAPRIAGLEGLKIGIVWQSQGDQGIWRERSFPLAQFQVLSQIENVTLVSLQMGRGRQQMSEIAGRMKVVDPLGGSNDADTLADIAAIARQLDLIITPDDTAAHLCGALGIPTWVILGFTSDPCWLADREDSPWYPGLRIYRQLRRGDWGQVFARVAEDARAKVTEVTSATGAKSGVAARIKLVHDEGRRAFARGNLIHAVELFQHAIALDPTCSSAHHDLAVVLAKQKKFDLAIVHFRRSIELDDSIRSAHSNLGLALIESADYPSAVEVLRGAVAKFPKNAELHCRLGIALSAMALHDLAFSSFAEALRIQPQYAEAHYALANEHKRVGNFSDAVESYRQAIRLRPNWAEAFNHLGLALAAGVRHDQAIEAYRAAIRLKRDFTDAYNNLAVSLADSNRLEEATEEFQHALYLQPDNPETHRNLAISLLLQGKYEQGWLEYQWRLRSKGVAKRRLPGRRWDGYPLGGKSLLLVSEQGLGDTLQFVRYASLAKAQGAKVILECQPQLTDFLSRCPFLDQVIAQGSEIPPCDFHCHLMSMPVLLHTTLDSVPASIPYLTADEKLVLDWGSYFRHEPSLRVGIVWRGSRRYAGDRHRSIPLSAFRPLQAIDRIDLISLQKDLGLDELEAIDFSVRRIERFESDRATFDDTAALLSNLDCLVTCDTAAAHLAAGLGKRVYLALSTSSDWRWMRDRDNSPWYPTVHLFRQSQSGQWSDVFARIVAKIQSDVAAGTIHRSNRA